MNRISQAFSDFWASHEKDFPNFKRDEAAILFYCGVNAGVDVAHQMRLDNIEKKYGSVDRALAELNVGVPEQL